MPTTRTKLPPMVKSKPVSTKENPRRYTQTQFNEICNSNNAFQMVMVMYWFEEGIHVVVDDDDNVKSLSDAVRSYRENPNG